MVKTQARAITLGVLKGTVLVPILGLMGHIGRCLTPDIMGPDYSLKNRFITAYNPRATWKTQSYHVIPKIDGKYETSYMDEYSLTPDGTLALHILFGLIGGLGPSEDFERRKKAKQAQLAKDSQNQK